MLILIYITTKLIISVTISKVVGVECNIICAGQTGTQGRGTQGRGTQGRGTQGHGTQGHGTQGRGQVSTWTSKTHLVQLR